MSSEQKNKKGTSNDKRHGIKREHKNTAKIDKRNENKLD